MGRVIVARESVRRIIQRIEDPALSAVEIVAPHKLIPRESTNLRG